MPTAKEGERYVAVMNEIKSRIGILKTFIGKNYTTGSDISDIEFCYLQIRIVLELIALSSISPNRKLYEKKREQFRNDWNAKLIFSDMRRLNKDFYPVPLVAEKSEHARVKFHFTKLRSGFLTKKQFLKLYDKCGSVLHAKSPFKKPPDYVGVYEYIENRIGLIEALLAQHSIKIPSSEAIWFMLMESGPAKQVQLVATEPIKDFRY